jgi:hypothetical protein
VNFAISTLPSGHDWLPPLLCDEVVCTIPAATRSAPISIMAIPIREPRMSPIERVAVFILKVPPSRRAVDIRRVFRLCIDVRRHSLNT